MDALIKPDIGLMFWTIVNFLLLAFLLAKFAWKPLIKALDDREKQIAEDISGARKAKEDAETIKKQLLPILLSQLAGCIVGVVSVVLIAKWMGASDDIIYSLAPKSVTTPIAMEVTKSLGGIPSLTAAVVVCVGLLGGILGFKTMRITHIGSPMAQGLSLGTAAHAVGTSTAMDVSRKYGAFASLGLTLNGILTALFTPTILRLLGLL